MTHSVITSCSLWEFPLTCYVRARWYLSTRTSGAQSSTTLLWRTSILLLRTTAKKNIARLTMNTKMVVTLLALFLVSATLTEATPLARFGSELRCQCISTHATFIPPSKIQDVTLTQSGPHCSNVEVIATLKDGRQICLDPTKNWVKVIIKAILKK
ncbi:interleukin-8-like isoform X2 [Pogona vitticeps]